MGNSIRCVSSPVEAHSEDVNAESTPPDTPTTKPFRALEVA
jgi:hypothetical protein